MKNKILKEKIRHVDIARFNATPIIEQYADMAFQARNLARAAHTYDAMLADKNCSIILCLSGSLFSAGLKKVVRDLVANNMVDAIVSSGAIIVDQDFFEALGFFHYKGSPYADDSILHKQAIDRIYDTFIDEDQLRLCDEAVKTIADSLQPRPWSSREFIVEMGRYLDKSAKKIAKNSVVHTAFKKGVPIFVPAFSDSSAGFGLLEHQWNRPPETRLSIDSVKDFGNYSAPSRKNPGNCL